jgi:hypothetical protein
VSALTAPDLSDVLAARQRIAAPDRFAGRSVAIVCSGGNLIPAQLVSVWPAAG